MAYAEGARCDQISQTVVYFSATGLEDQTYSLYSCLPRLAKTIVDLN